ncbi:MAG TPA: hypothetical protein VGW10_00770, partial [Solirubrobacteraceae bacterium]|nr:hypothetical protein [Solirubrobacteraceae bacterium]
MVRSAACLGALLGLALAPSALAFGGPVDVSQGGSASGAGIAAHPAGGGAVAWKRASDSRVVVRRVAPDGALDEVGAVSGEAATSATPAVGLAGADTVVGWICDGDDHFLVRRIGSDGALGPVWDVSQSSLNEINGASALAANASGRVAVAWRRPSDSDVLFRAFDVATGPSSAIVELTSDPDIALYGTNVQVAIGADGAAAVVWHRNTDCDIIVRRIDAAGNAGPQEDVSGQPDSAVGDTNPSVAIDDAGDAIAAWHRDVDHHAVTRRWRADGSLADLADIASGQPASMANFGIAALPASAAVAWQREADGHVLVSNGGAPVDVSTGPAASAPAAART